MRREGKLVKNTIILSVGNFFPKLVAIFTLPILTAQLTKTEYGTFDLVSTLVALLLPVVTLQIQSAAFRFLIDCRNDIYRTSIIVTNIFAVIIPISTVVLLILYFCLNGIDPFTRLIICIYFFIDILYIAIQQVARGLSFNLSYSVASIILSLQNIIMLLIFVLHLGWGLKGTLLSLIISYMVSMTFLILRIRKYCIISFNFISLSSIKEMLAYSWPMVPNNLSNWVLALSDRLIITAFLGVEANAVFAVANKIPYLFTTVQSTFTMAWQENASMASGDSDACNYYSKIFNNVFSLLSGMMAILIAFTPILFSQLIKGDYDEAYYQMPLLFLSMLFSCLSSFLGGIYVASKKITSVGITTIVAAACHVIINLTLIKKLGITACSVSTLISYLVLVIYRMLDLKRIQSIKYNYRKIALFLFILTIMSVISYQRVMLLDLLNFGIAVPFACIGNRKLLKFGLSIMKKSFSLTTQKVTRRIFSN